MGKVLAPHAPVTRDDNLQSSVHNVTSELFTFSFLYFLFFWDQQGCCPCSYVSSGAMRNLDLRNSLKMRMFVCQIGCMLLKGSFLINKNKRGC